MKHNSRTSLTKLDWLIAGAFAVVAAILYFAGMANFAFPGESARLMVVWSGLDVADTTQYPLMAMFAKLLGGGNALAPVVGLVATAGLYLLSTFFIRYRIGGEHTEKFAVPASRIAGIATASLFMLSPAVRSAATHLEPRLFALAWAVLSLLPLLLWINANGIVERIYPVFIGILWGIGAIDSVLFVVLLPLVIASCAAVPLHRGRKAYVAASLFFLSTLVSFSVAAICCAGWVETVTDLWVQFKAYGVPKGWMVVLFFATTAFVVSIFSSKKAFNEESGWVQWTFHIAMGICSILMIATPLSPSSIMEPAGILPCAACAYAACVAGYLLAYWWLMSVTTVRRNESDDRSRPVALRQRLFAYVCGGLLVVVYVFTAFFNLFTFDSSRGAFADRVADKILDDLGERSWFVSDGTLDDNLRLRAAERGKDLVIVSLSRDFDKPYLERLAQVVKERGVGGEHNTDLSLSLSLGVLPFVQDWFSSDPQAGKTVAIFGAPDLWYAAGLTPVPEFVFFGADAERTPDWSAWKEFSEILDAPDGWGSYQLHSKTLSPAVKTKLELRRHLGLVANDRGVWLQEQGRDDEAFDMYSLVLDEIDSDNICALFNLFEMARSKHPKALAKKFDYERRLKQVVEDAERRYRLWALGNYYGYIRQPDVLIQLGYNWARSGRPGEAMQQFRRAIDLIPTDRRNSIFNMMAAMYANESDRTKSREMYQQVLAKDSNDHDALIGLMRLSLADGDEKAALEYLERAVQAGGDDPRIRTEQAMAAFMRNDLDNAKKILKEVTDRDATDLHAWSLLAAVTIQQCDAAKDDATRKRLERELEDKLLPTMEKQARDPYDYYVQTIRGFILMRKGEEKRREARDALVVASRSRPDIAVTREIVLGLDIALNDAEAAESHARETLRNDRKNPTANYIMGALAMRKDNYDEAMQYLHRAADSDRAIVMAMNDLAEAYRRKKNYEAGEKYARKAIKSAPEFYVPYETLGTIIVERGGNLDEAQQSIEKAVELSTRNGKVEDVRMLISLARVQALKGDRRSARMTLRKVQTRVDELSAYEKVEYEELRKKVKATDD